MNIMLSEISMTQKDKYFKVFIKDYNDCQGWEKLNVDYKIERFSYIE
jgi:hypothetical protein